MTDDFMSTARAGGDGLQRGRGGFLRGANGAPWVTDPAGALVRSGPRKGLPRRIQYGSPSGRGSQIENTTNLHKWDERQIVFGFGVDPTLVAMCQELVRLDPQDLAHKQLADKIIVHAKMAARAMLSADRGTHTHAILQDDDEGRDWQQRAEAGLLLGIPLDGQRALVEAWRRMLVEAGLEILVSEASCVDDAWHLAGTLDNLAVTHHPLRFRMVTGELLTIPAGAVIVLDKKTGQYRTDGQGAPQHWHNYAIQIASYAQSVYYDTEKEVRAPWPWPVDQTHALIAHLDVLAAIDGRPVTCDLVYVDLVAGREHGGRCAEEARLWQHRNDLFSVAHVGADEVAGVEGAGDGTPVAPIAPASPAAPDLPPGSLAPPANRREWLRARCQSVAAHSADAAAHLAAMWPPTLPPLSSDHPHTSHELDTVEAMVEIAEAHWSAPFVSGDPAVAPLAARGEPAEGHDVSAQDIATLASHLTELSTNDLDRCRLYAAQAAATGRSISLAERPSIRRYEIARALYHFCRAGWDDALIHAVLDSLTGLPGTVGLRLGVLTEARAAQLADVAAAHAAGSLIATVQPDGQTVWTDGSTHIYTAQAA